MSDYNKRLHTSNPSSSFGIMTLLRITLAALVLLIWSGTTTKLGFGQDPFGDADPFEGFGSNTDAQEADPFGGADAGFSPPPAATPSAEAVDAASSTATESDPIVRKLRESPPRSIKDFANAFTWMSRIKRWDEVRRLLDLLASKNFNLQQQADLSRVGGTTLWLRLTNDDVQLTDAQRATLQQLLRAPATLAKDAKAIDDWIAQLASDTPGVRRVAQLRLQDGGDVAIMRMLDLLMSGSEQVAPIMLAGTIAEFGADGEDALRAACFVQDAERSSRVLTALAEMANPKFTMDLGAAMLSTRLPVTVQLSVASEVAKKFTKLPEDEAIAKYLAAQFERRLSEYKLARGMEAASKIWLPTEDGQSVQAVEGTAEQLSLERLAQVAAYEMSSRTLVADTRARAGAALLQRAYHMNPGVEDSSFAQHLLVSLDEFSDSANFWTEAFHYANTQELHGAAIRCIQTITALAKAGSIAPPLDFLSGLLTDSRPIVRYTALASIASLDPQMSFAGDETAVECAVEMSQLTSGPQCLVVGLMSELRQAAAQQLQMQTGSAAVTVNSGAAALLELDRSSPFELVVVVDRVADMSLFQLLQRLRHSQNGASLPIAVLTDQLYQHERTLISETPGIITSVLSRNPEHMGRVLQDMIATLGPGSMSSQERGYFAGVAADFLSMIAADRETYAFYPVSDFRELLVNTQVALTPMQEAQVLASLGTAESQRRLVSVPGNSAFAEQTRVGSAKAFADSVKRFGMLMNREDVNRCYELYNSNGPTDPVTSRALGYVLDVIEANAGEKEWPEGL